MKERYPVFEKYHIIVQACSNINVLFQRLKQEENLQNSIINSRIKMAAPMLSQNMKIYNLLILYQNKD